MLLALDKLGVDYIEGGWPGANPTDTEFFQKKHTFINAKLTSFGMTKKTGRSADNDPGLSALIKRKYPSCLYWWANLGIFMLILPLGISNEENLKNINREQRNILLKKKKNLCLMLNIFLMDTKQILSYAISCLKSAFDEGARWIVLCDTNGGTLTS